MIRVIAIDDHPLMLRAVVEELERQPDIEVAGTGDHGSQLHALVREKRPQVVILDLGMSSGNFEPVTAVKALLYAHPEVRVLVLTGYDDPHSIRALVKAGATGYILKHEDLSLALPQAVRALVRGERFYSPAVLQVLLAQEWAEPSTLTAQEVQVVRLVAQGLQNNRIGEALGVSEKRIRNILTEVYEKLGVHESGEVHPRMAVVNQARALGLLVEK